MIERLSKYIDYKGVSVSFFESSIGASDGMLRRAIGKKTDIQSKWIAAISENYHDINLIWLITGKGEMLLDLDEKNCKANCEVDCKVEEKLLPELLPKLLLSTKSDKKNTQANIQVAEKCTPECTPKCTPVDQKSELALSREVPINVAHPVERGGIPLIPIEAVAGALSGPLQAMDFECEYYVIPSFKNAEFMIRITGDSMIPKYQAGDIVACQRLSLGTFFQWNNVYVVDSEQGALIKRVKRGSDKEHILLVSENQDYEPFELPLSEINGLGQVVGIVRLE